MAGPFQVFVRASELFLRDHPSPKPHYKVFLASTTASKNISTNCGISLLGHLPYSLLPVDIDTLLVAGGSGLDKAGKDKELLRRLRLGLKSLLPQLWIEPSIGTVGRSPHISAVLSRTAIILDKIQWVASNQVSQFTANRILVCRLYG